MIDRLQIDSQEMLKNKRKLRSVDFLIHMFGAGKSSDVRCKHTSNFTYFWDQPVKSSSPGREVAVAPHPLIESIWDDVFRWTWAPLYAEVDEGCSVLLQLWAPIKTESGRRRLRVSQQPFGVGGGLCYGLCMYRRHCTENEDKYGEFGPPGRVFRQQFPEYCPDIACYSTQEFPTRDYAISCGIVRNWALPLFEYDETRRQHCVGVLECVSFGNYDLLTAIPEPWGSKFEFSSAHLHRCNRVRNLRTTQSGIGSVLTSVREAYQLPLIQVWGTCMCDNVRHDDKLFCEKISCSKNLKYLLEFKKFNRIHGACYVKAGESLVRRAYSEDRPCFSRDTSLFSLSDYPFTHLTRSSGLTACFVIPLELVHFTLYSLFLEIFLPPDQNHNIGNLATVLESILSTLVLGFSKVDIAVGLEQHEHFCAEVSHSDSEEIVYFDVKRIINTENSCSIEPSPNDSNAHDTTDSSMEVNGAQYMQNAQDTIAKVINLDVLESCPNVQDSMYTSGEVIATITEDQITLDEQHPDAHDTNDSSEEVIATVAEDQITLGVPHPNEHDTNDSAGEFIAAMAGDQITPDVPYPNAHSTNNSSGEVIAAMVEDQITLDVLKPYFGNNINAAAVDLGVSRSTLKRRCRVLGIMRWPWHKRNKVRHIQPSSGLQPSQIRINATEKEAERETAADSVPSGSNGDRICQSYDMIGKATYGDDTVMFPLKTSCGIKELRKDLDQKFQLQAEKFKIKYKYEDEWFLITCDQELHLGMEMIKSTGKNTINLSILPLPTS